jgi:hypothetical protein
MIAVTALDPAIQACAGDAGQDLTHADDPVLRALPAERLARRMARRELPSLADPAVHSPDLHVTSDEAARWLGILEEECARRGLEP